MPLQPEPQAESFDTPLVPVQPETTPRVPGDTMAFSPEEVQTAAAQGGAIPTLNGSFDTVGQAASAAWQAGRPLSELLDTQPASQTPSRPTGTERSFTVPQQGEAAELRVSTTVGNSASAPISSPPSAAKADPHAMQLAAAAKEPPKPYCYPSLNLFNATRPDDEAGAAREMKKTPTRW